MTGQPVGDGRAAQLTDPARDLARQIAANPLGDLLDVSSAPVSMCWNFSAATGAGRA